MGFINRDSTADIMNGKTALITGAAKRIGAQIARTLHEAGCDIIIHYRSSESAAKNLCKELNDERPNSAYCLQADLDETDKLGNVIDQAAKFWGRLDLLVNNASSFYPTPLGTITTENWDDLFNSNLKAPLFLSQAAIPYLRLTSGSIVNMVDVHAYRPMRKHAVYCAAKAGLAMLTQALAKDLGPEIRVNGVAPGAILWPENDINNDKKNIILERTALKRPGDPEDVAKTILFLARDADYITGQVIPVDGGRSLHYYR